MRKSTAALALLLLVFPFFAQAIEPINYSIHQHYVSPRALGMGNAFIAVVDDYNALFYNPAALAKQKEGQINLKIQFGGSSNILDFGKQLSEAGDATDKDTAYADVLNKNYGSNFYSRFPNVGGTWARPGWAVSVIPADLSAELAVHQQVAATLTMEGYQDSTIAFGKAQSFLDDSLQVGATIKGIYRGYVLWSKNAVELVYNDQYFTPEDAKEGMTVDLDVGVLYALKGADKGGPEWTKWAKPTFAFTARNLVDYGFGQNFHLYNKESGNPPKLERRFDLGTMVEFPGFWVFQPRFALDIKDMGHRNWTFKKGLHTGVELLWNVKWWLQGGYRMGLNQGYLTAGLSAQFVWFRLDFATWGEEIGTTGAPKESRRYVAQMSLDF